ncbi:MAG: NAD-dependent epimerase/dehydratase family protein [Phycisphaerae bacterium]
MRVLVTGHRGYIGSVLTCILRHARFDVVGLDCDLYGDCTFGRIDETIPTFEGDVRDIQFSDLTSFDAIIHLAAYPEHLEDDRLSEKAAALNRDMTIELAEKARMARVSRFLLGSTTAVYGQGAGHVFDEDDHPRPIDLASKYRLEAEHAVLAMGGARSDSAFEPVIARIAEVYGVSPRLRLDQAVNDMVGAAVATGRVVLNQGSGGWRSLVHVEDVSRAMACLLKAGRGNVSGQVFNLSCPDEHYQLVDIADQIIEFMPMVTRSVLWNDADLRNRRTNGSKLTRVFGEFSYRWKLPLGIQQLRSAFISTGIAAGECRSDRFRRASRFAGLIEVDGLDDRFRVLGDVSTQDQVA